MICTARLVYHQSSRQDRRCLRCCARDDREARRQANAPGVQKPKPKFGILADVDANGMFTDVLLSFGANSWSAAALPPNQAVPWQGVRGRPFAS